MIDHVRIEAVMKKLKRSFTMRTVFLAVATVALLTSTAIFMSVGAAGEVTPSDLTADAPSAESGTESEAVVDEPSADEPKGSGEKVKVTPSDLKADASVFRIVSPSEMLDPVSSNPDLGAPVATMTTTGSTIYLIYLSITGTDVYIDKGNGAPASYGNLNEQRVSFQTTGNTIRLYGDITELDCRHNELTTLDVSNNTALTHLGCSFNQLTALDVSNNTALTYLDCGSNQLTALDVSNNTALTYLGCYQNPLTSLDVSNNTALTRLVCERNQLTALDVSNNTALTDLSCGGNPLTALDVSNNTALTELFCWSNQLTSLDVSKNTALTQLICGSNYFTALDVSNNTALTGLWCGKNQLTSLDVSNNTALTSLDCEGNNITALDLSNNSALTWLSCDGNHLTMPTIYGFNADRFTNCFTYAPQTHVIPASVSVGGEVDLSSEASVDGVATEFTWYDSHGNVVTPATSNGGVFTFGENAAGKTLVCKMTNAKLPDFNGDNRLTTTEVTIEGASVNSAPVATMTTAAATGSTISLGITGTDVYIDKGDGNPVSYGNLQYDMPFYNVSFETAGNTIRLYGNITVMNCESNQQFTSLNVSGCAALTELYCRGNQLTTLDVSNNTALETLWCGNNQLTALDVSNNTTLTNLLCESNQLTALDVSNNTALTGLYCSANQLTTLNVSKNTALTGLHCSENQLTALDMSHNTALTGLGCSSNQLTALNVSKNTALEYLDCERNHLTALNVSNNTALTTLYCWGNQLTALNVSKNTALTGLRCGINQLTALDVSNNTALTELNCGSNQLSSLDVSKNTALTSLDCGCNQLTALDVSNNTALTELWCLDNRMTMQTIYGINAGNSLTEFQYAPQTHVIPASVSVGGEVDLSSEYSVDGVATEFTWYDSHGNVVTPATSNGGVFTFGENAAGKTLVCEMTNAKLPDFRTGTDSYEEFDEDGNPTGNTVTYDCDNRLTTTEVTIEGASVNSDPVASDPVAPDPVDPVSSDDGGNGGASPRTPLYELTYEQNDEIKDLRTVQYPEGTIVEINGRKFDLHSIFGIRLNIGHIDKSQRKPILDAIKVFNKSFDPDTNNIIFYEMNLEDSNQAHVNIVKGHVLICMNYPENLPKQWNKYVFHLYHQRKDGSIEEIPVNCMANGIWCTATDFSPYVLCWDEAKIESAGTGESMVIINVMAILFFVSAMSMNLVLYRRRRLMRNL